MAELTDIQALAELRHLAECHFGQLDRTEPLKGDGSERRIFRLHPQDKARNTVVGVVNNNLHENSDFVTVTRSFQKAKLRVPALLSINSTGTCYLLQDLGSDTLADCIVRWRKIGESSRTVNAYRDVLVDLIQMQRELPKLLGDFLKQRRMGLSVFQSDLAYFKRDFVERFGLERTVTASVDKEFSEILNELSRTFGDECFVYRDLQSRNIMWFGERPWYIDYQSAFIGPRYYDLASLLYASRSGLSEPERELLLRYYYDMTGNGIAIACDEFKRLFLLFVVVRRLRSLGTYGFLSCSKGKAEFFSHIAPSLKQLSQLLHGQAALEPYPAVRGMVEQFQETWIDDADTVNTRPKCANS